MDLHQAALTLVRDHAEKRNITPFARGMGARDLDDAYLIQRAFVEQLRALHGPSAGYKIGLTSVRMQQMCSVDHPVAGVVLQSRVLPSGSRIRLESLVRLGIEFEICVRLGKSLLPRARPYDLDDVALRLTPWRPHSKSSTIATRPIRSICTHWSRITPGMKVSCSGSLKRLGPISRRRAASSS